MHLATLVWEQIIRIVQFAVWVIYTKVAVPVSAYRSHLKTLPVILHAQHPHPVRIHLQVVQLVHRGSWEQALLIHLVFVCVIILALHARQLSLIVLLAQWDMLVLPQLHPLQLALQGLCAGQHVPHVLEQQVIVFPVPKMPSRLQHYPLQEEHVHLAMYLVKCANQLQKLALHVE